MKVLIKRGVKEALPEDFHTDRDFSGQPKAVKEMLSSDTFSFFFFIFLMVELR